jgi:hypothetical protein
MNVVIVESPAKAQTINKYLGKDYEVFASFGHVRDLPAKDGSVDPEDDFAMRWDMDPKASKRMTAIAAAVKGASKVILATDPDREGEAISWHVLEILRGKKVLKDKKIERVVFNAITKSAILEAMQHPREIDGAKVLRVTDYEQDTVIDAEGERVPPEEFILAELADGRRVAVRASGTEPKAKFYAFARAAVADADDLPAARERARAAALSLRAWLEADAQRRAR